MMLTQELVSCLEHYSLTIYSLLMSLIFLKFCVTVGLSSGNRNTWLGLEKHGLGKKDPLKD